MTENGIESVGAVCDSCDWELTIADVIKHIEDDRVPLDPTPQRIRKKFGSLGEGHAYFNRGHRTGTCLSTDEIEHRLDIEEL